MRNLSRRKTGEPTVPVMAVFMADVVSTSRWIRDFNIFDVPISNLRNSFSSFLLLDGLVLPVSENMAFVGESSVLWR